jgi:hypothetical protein
MLKGEACASHPSRAANKCHREAHGIPLLIICCKQIATELKRRPFFPSPILDMRRPLIAFSLLSRAAKSADCDIDSKGQGGLELSA